MQSAPPSASPAAAAPADAGTAKAGPPTLARRGPGFGPNLVRLISLLVVLALWEYYGRSVNPVLFTYPSAIAGALVELTASGELWTFLQQSLTVLAIGLP